MAIISQTKNFKIMALENELERLKDAMERLKHYNRKLLDDCIKMDNEISVLKADKLELVKNFPKQ